MATLRDVAKLAGVSAMTVSNVVNGREGKVSEQTIARVREAIEELGYVPNAQARALAGAPSRIVALVYGVFERQAPLSMSHESLFVGACEEACRAEGRVLMLCGCQIGEEEAVLARLQAWNVAGVIMLGSVPEALQRRLVETGVAVVAVDLPGKSVEEIRALDGLFGSVGIDDVGGGRLAGEHLSAAGHRKAVFIAPHPAEPGVDSDRLAGFTRAFGSAVRVISLPLGYAAAVELGQSLALELRAADETAVFTSSDITAMGVVSGLRRSGVRVPDDVSVVGFDGFAVSTYCDPVLTTVAQPIAQKASRAVALLRSLVAGEMDIDSAVTLPVQWREGGTLGPRR